MNDFRKVLIKFDYKKNYSQNNRKPKIINYEETMEIVFSQIKSFSEKLINFNDEYTKLEAPLNIWRQFYQNKTLRFVEDKKYSLSFSRKILHENYKTLTLIYDHMSKDLIKNQMITYYEPTKKRYFKGKFLNSIIQNNQTVFW